MSAHDPLVGRVFAKRFELLERLDQGGMGAVYRARQLSVGREVALKVLHPNLAQRSDAVERFKREAKTLCQVEHPAIVTLFDFGEAETGELFLVMELLSGETLGSLLAREGALPIERALALTRLLAEALDAAHRRHIVHRDLKPDNLWLPRVAHGPERLKVLDFGLARSVHAQTTLTGPGVIFGTPAYMAPEVIAGRPIGPAADLYAVGCILHHMLTGAPPFSGSSDSTEPPSVEALFAAHLFNPPPPLPEHVPAPLRELVTRLLDKEPRHRLGSAADLLAALDALSEDLDPSRRRTASEAPRAPRRPRAWLVPLLALTVAAGVAVSFSLSEASGSAALEPQPPPQPEGELESKDAPSVQPAALPDGTPAPVARVADTSQPTPAPTTPTAPAPTAPTPATPKAEDAAAQAPAPTTITLTLESTPPSSVTLDGQPAGSAPGELTLPRASTTHTLRFSRAGHKPVTRKVASDRDQVVRVRLPRVEADEWMAPPGTPP